MKKSALIYALFAFVLGFAGAKEGGAQENHITGRVIGGEPSVAGRYPWTTFLQIRSIRSGQVIGSQMCGGSLIAPNWVLTAAHCFQPIQGADALAIDAKIGVLDRTSSAGDLRYAIQLVVHPNYNHATHENDLALIELNAASTKQPIYLPDADIRQAIVAGTPVTVAGWGTTTAGGSSAPTVLQEAGIHISSQSTCAANYARVPYTITSNMVCAADPGQDSCQGDSGGPLMFHFGGRSYLAGVTSFGYGCAQAQYPGVYVRIGNYVDWIAQKIYDSRQPEARIVSPALSGQRVSGLFYLTATAIDNIAVSQVQFLVDNVVLHSFNRAPYEFVLDTFRYANGAHSFSVRVYDVFGNVTTASQSFTVTNAAPAITSQPTNLRLVNGTSGMFSVAATGSALSYQWQVKRSGTTTWQNISGATGANYRVTAASTLANASYRVRVSNRLGAVYSVVRSLQVVERVTITTQPRSQSVGINRNVSLSVAVRGTAPRYQWQFRRSATASWSNVAGATASSYAFTATQLKAGQYRVSVRNEAGVVTSGIATLSVVAAPVINAQPASVTTRSGQLAVFKVRATGSGLNYRWETRANSTAAWKVVTGATGVELRVTAVAAKAGQYRAVVRNLGGEKASTAAVLVVR